MSDNKRDDAFLDTLFEEAVSDIARPSDGLMDRVLADALDNIPVAKNVMQRTMPHPKAGFFTQLFGAIGGWPAVAGLATATVAGVWVGFYPTDMVSDVMAQYSGSDSELYLVDISTSIGSLFEES